ncbi:MAG TPA: AAA family ATPase, partial [Pyrinomonadaceae bacterium]
FSDLKEERNALQKYVFPKLRELCLRHGCRFQAIDLRWGVSEEAGLDQQTVKVCLQEIKRCQKLTPRPNFVVLLGDRYGWRPLPAEILASEYEQIEQHIADADDQGLLKRWYWRDDNAVPAVYCLQPRTGDFRDYARWQAVERRLHSALLQAAGGMTLPPGEQVKYGASATEQEIIRGALDVHDAHEHVFCFFRQISNFDDLIDDLARNENAESFLDLDENMSPDREALTLQRELIRRLRDSLPGNIHDYEAEWQGDGITTAHIGKLPEGLEDCLRLIGDENAASNLCIDVWRRLARIILKEVGTMASVDSLQKEIDDHTIFGKERATLFTGRGQYLKAIGEYVRRTEAHPFALWGSSGSGKSALLARAAAQVRSDYPDAEVIVRFIGATPGSTDGRTLLDGVCRQICRLYGSDDADVATDYNDLVEDFPRRLASATADHPLFVFIDGLDQLSDFYHARNLTWLPAVLPEHARLIVSTLPGECLPMVKTKIPESNVVELEPMLSEEGRELLNSLLAQESRTLREHQREVVVRKFDGCRLPLYLKLVFEEAKNWKSYTGDTSLGSDSAGIIQNLFERLSSDTNHGKMLVSRSLGYMVAAKYGLSEDEMHDVLSRDDDVFEDFIRRAHHQPPEKRLPVVVWSRLYFDLEPYLIERGADGTS